MVKKLCKKNIETTIVKSVLNKHMLFSSCSTRYSPQCLQWTPVTPQSSKNVGLSKADDDTAVRTYQSSEFVTFCIYRACTGERKLKPLKPFRGNIDIATGKLILK